MLDRKLLLGSTVMAGFAAALAVATPAVSWAQTAQAAQASKPKPATTAEEEEKEVEALVVTGSRIKRSEFTSSAPIQVITAEQSSLEGLVDTTDILQQSTLASGSFQWNNQLTGYVTNGGPGGNSVSLRGLGEQRTLVLLNGRRAGPAGVSGRVGPFDLNVIPSSLIERVEILKDGASSIYGSDAVAGVVNIITKTNLDGFEANVYGNKSFDGGGDQYRINVAWGKTFERGYINGAVDYFELKALKRKDRDDTACASDYLFNPSTHQMVDYLGLNGKVKCYNLPNAYVSDARPTATNVFGNLMPIANLPAGFVLPTAAQGNIGAGNTALPAGWARWGRAGYPATYPYAPYESELYDNSTTISPVKRTTISLNGGYDITPNLEIYGEFLWNRRESEQIGAGQIFQSFAQLNTLLGAANNLPASNPNNPFGFPVTTVSAYASNAYQEVNYTRFLGGIRGSLDILGGWDWDLYAQYSKSDATYNNGDRVYLDRLLALNSPGTACTNTPLGGNVSGFNCSALPAGIPWTSTRVLNGQFTDAERAFLFFNEESNTTYEHKYVEGSVSGNLFTLPAGPLGAAFGFQIRQEEIDDKPGPVALARNMALFTSAGRTAGSDRVKEVFTEFSIPVFKGLPGVESFDVNLSGRYSDYKSYGSSKTYKVGLNWQIDSSWRIRATQGTSFRAPALYEQYLGAQTGYQAQSVVDPCYDYGNSTTNTARMSANCLAQGIPNNKLGGSSVTVYSIGGAGVVGPESALARTVGVIWTPSFIDLSVAVDYFEFDVKDEVRQFGANNILRQCYDAPDFPTSPYCTLFQRDATTHDVLFVNNAYVNVARQVNRGIDLTTRYRHEFDFGTLTIDTQFTWQLQDTTRLLATASEIDDNGSTTEPDFTGQINTRFDRGDWTVFWGVDMIGKTSDTEQQAADVFPFTRYANLPGGINSSNCALPTGYCVYYKQYAEFTAYHDVSVRRRMDDWTFAAGIQNVFDERPPAQSNGQFRLGTAALNLYDMVGRRAFISISKKW